MSRHETLVIRRASLDDVERLVTLAADAFRSAYHDLDDPQDLEDYVGTHFTPAYFASHLASAGSSVVLLAFDGDDLVGYALAVRSAPPACVQAEAPVELSRLYLREDAIGKGRGAALMKAVLAEVTTTLGGKSIWLAVYHRNVRARAFYQRWGFADVGTKPFLFGGAWYEDPVMLSDFLHREAIDDHVLGPAAAGELAEFPARSG